MTATELPTPRDADGVNAALLSVQQVARFLNCSVRHLYRLADRGAMPRPVRLGGLVRWRRTEIEQWIALGCPATWTGNQR